MTTIWRVPSISVKEWIGPLTVTANGIPTTNYQIAFTEYGSTPTVWEDPTPHPDNAAAGLGVVIATESTHPITAGKAYLIQVQVDLGVSEPVIDDVVVVLAQ